MVWTSPFEPFLSLRRSGHDAGFVGGRDRSDHPLLLWILRTLFLLGVAACLGPLFGGDIRLGSLGLGPEQT